MFKVGDKVKDILRGEGEVTLISGAIDDPYPVIVKFQEGNKITEASYTLDGKFIFTDDTPNLSLIEPQAEPSQDHVVQAPPLTQVQSESDRVRDLVAQGEQALSMARSYEQHAKNELTKAMNAIDHVSPRTILARAQAYVSQSDETKKFESELFLYRVDLETAKAAEGRLNDIPF